LIFNKAELEKAVKELAFDVQHYRCYARLYREGDLRKCSPTVEHAVRYSLLLHFRLLLDFFYAQPEDDDCCVDHFRVLPEFAATFRLTTKPRSLEAVRTTLHKRLARLSATRWTHDAPPFRYYASHLDRIDKLIVKFENALPDDVKHIFTEHIRRWDVSHRARV
jgi:hypothetical protein